MRKLLITGLGIGKIYNNCYPCNFDYSWLINFPSVFLWADKILVPKPIWDIVSEQTFPKPQKLANSYKMVFDIAYSKDLIEIVDPLEVLTEEFHDIVYDQIDKDIKNLQLLFPKLISFEKDPDNPTVPKILIDGINYCPPILWSLYLSLALSRYWNANCLFDPTAIHYFRYKFGSTGFPKEINFGYPKSFRDIFNLYLPNTPLLPKFSVESPGKCSKCKHENNCSDNYLFNLEQNLEQYFEWRNYDEICQIKELSNNVIKKNEYSDSFIDPRDIIHDFIKVEKQIKNRLRKVFPKVKRWSNISTVISIPLAIFGAATQNPLLTVGGASVAGLAKLSTEVISFFENKYKWVSFTPSNVRQKNIWNNA